MSEDSAQAAQANEIPADDPRRLLHEGDLEKAYPQHAKEKQHREKIDAAIAFLQWLVAKGDVKLCRTVTRAHYRLFSDDTYDADELLVISSDPYSRAWQRLAFEWQGVDFDAFFREKEVMYDLFAQVQQNVLAKKAAEAQSDE